MCVNIYIYIIYKYVYVCIHICIFIQVPSVCIYGQASGVPSTPPPPQSQWYGLVRGGGGGGGWGGGAGVCGEGWGLLELQLEKRPSVTDKASIVRSTQALRKPYIL